MRIVCIVDNYAPLTSREILSEHGVSFMIEDGDVRVLLDTSQTGRVLKHNASVLGIDLSEITHVVLSHGHYDHTGGLRELLEYEPVVIASSHAFKPKYSKSRYIGSPVSLEEVEKRTEVILRDEDYRISSEIILTGEIPRTNSFESSGEFFLDEERKTRDPLKDDRSLIVKDTLITGCCHAGIVNTLDYVERKYEIRRIIGGLHLHSSSGERISKTVERLKKKGYELFVGHCTGLNVLCRFSASGLSARPLHSGFTLEL
ncbi:MAG: MBL fold metallo-hydrolase [Archaeoglobi archaeon]|nr:MBL fold metallo-hydrolase [Candidatus Mnemosynella bozhongmuii]